jgi:hypothetical protein
VFIDILGVVHLFMFFWTSAFLIGATEKLISGAVFDWNEKQGTAPRLADVNPIVASCRRVANAHIGSVALGALLIGLTSLPRLLLETVFELSRNVPLAQNLCCLCNLCFTRVLGMISKYNYVIVYLDGTGFWQSGKRVVELMKSPNEEVARMLQLGKTALL